MTDAANSCPVGLTYYTQNSTRICSSSILRGGCTSVNFPTFGVPFTKVCGRALGYQYGHIDAFRHGVTSSIDSYYVEGLSVTHGIPRNHIWIFAAGYSKNYSHGGNKGVPPPTLVQLHLHLWERSIFVNLGTVDHLSSSGTLTTLCGTHRGVQVGAPAVIVVVRGSLTH